MFSCLQSVDILSLDKEFLFRIDSSFTTSKLLGNEISLFSLNLLLSGKFTTLTQELIVPIEDDLLLFVKESPTERFVSSWLPKLAERARISNVSCTSSVVPKFVGKKLIGRL